MIFVISFWVPVFRLICPQKQSLLLLVIFYLFLLLE